MRNAAVTDAGMDSLKGLVNLKELAVEDATITDDGLKVVRSFPRLEVLDVLRCQNISDDGLALWPGWSTCGSFRSAARRSTAPA